MDPIIIAIVVKALLAVLLVIGGIAALVFGRGLYLRGVGLQQDGTTFEIEHIKGSLKTVGSVVMATSVAWGGLGYLASPSLTQSPGHTEVASSTYSGFDVQARTLTYQEGRIGAQVNISDPVALQEAFSQAYTEAEASTSTVWINGNPTKIDLSRTTTFKTPADQSIVFGVLESENRDVGVTYIPKQRGDTILFEPWGVGSLDLPKDYAPEESGRPNESMQPTPESGAAGG